MERQSPRVDGRARSRRRFREHLVNGAVAGQPESLANRGRLVTCGAHGGGHVDVDMNDFYRRHLSIISAAAAPKEQVQTVYRLAGEGKLQAPIHRVFPLEEVREAHELVSSRDIFGRVVLAV